MSNLGAISRKIRKNYYQFKRFLNETIFVSIPAYKKLYLKEREVFYRNEVELLVQNAPTYASIYPEPTELFTDYSHGISLTDTSSDILKQTRNNRVIYYRGILPAYVSFFKELYACGILQAFSKAGRIAEIKPTRFYTNEYPLIVEVETLHVVNPVFWSFSMIRESVINLLIIDAALGRLGYGIIDGHPFNTAFKDGQPVLFDIGSFVKRKECQFKGELIHYALSTLLMRSINRSHFARHNIFSLTMPITSAEGKGISIEKQALYSAFRKFHKRHSVRAYTVILDEVFIEKRIRPEYVDVLFSRHPKLYDPQSLIRSDRYTEENRLNGISEFLSVDNSNLTEIVKLVQRFSPDALTSLDLAGSVGHFSSLLSKTEQFTSLISLDSDESAIEQGISLSENDKVTFYHVNPFFPFGDREVFSASVRSDVVVILGIMHDLLFVKQYKVHAIFSILSMYTNKYVYVEFTRIGDIHNSLRSTLNIPSWYTEDWFEEKFRLFFNLLHKEFLYTSNIDGNEQIQSIIYVGEKRIKEVG